MNQLLDREALEEQQRQAAARDGVGGVGGGDRYTCQAFCLGVCTGALLFAMIDLMMELGMR